MFHEVVAIIPSSSSKPSVIVTPEQKRQKKLLIILGVVVLITAGVLYYNYSSSPAAPSVPTNLPTGTPVSGEGEVNSLGSLPATGSLNVSPNQQEEIPSLQNVQLDFSVFDSPRFVALKEFTDKLDVSSIEKGRRNPFVKY